MEFIKGMLKVIDILTTTYLIYFIITGLCVLKERAKPKKANVKHKFAIIVPARNEERVIGNLLKSLEKQNYPKELYDTFVVINNCQDKTKEIAEKNAKIIECKIPVKSKGEALKKAFIELSKLDYEAYIIFDADNIVHPDFIDEMNNIFDEGYNLAQGFRDSKNILDTWISSCYSLHYLIHNIFLNKARMNIEKSSFINGTGVMISKKYLGKKTYMTHTLTEDIELTVRAAIEEEKIGFAQNAITYDEQPTTFKESWKQRKRWSIGTIQCLKIYYKKLFKNIMRKNNFSCIDALIFLISPIIQFVGLLSYASYFIIGILQGAYISYLGKIVALVLCYIASITLSVVTIKLSKKRIMPYIKGILTLPIFILSWIPINIIACFKQENKWDKIEHTKNITIDKILDIDYK